MTIHDLARIERESITAFMEECAAAGRFSGRVLDYGCGQQPYRGIVERGGGDYRPFDRLHFGGNVSRQDVGHGYGLRDPQGRRYHAILSTQVIQYVPDPHYWLSELHDALEQTGYLVLTGPTAWPELRDDLHRFTLLGIRGALERADFAITSLVSRAEVEMDGFSFSVGYAAVAQAV